MSEHAFPLPENLPVPIDDGAARHLPGRPVPAVALPSTHGGTVNLRDLDGTVVLYCYPRTGVPGEPLPQGWNDIPGARGCTPQSCAYRDHAAELAALGARVFGISTQSTDFQREAADRLHLPFALLSDERLQLATALQLPTMEVQGWTLLRRLTLIVQDGVVRHVFYPVFPPDRDAENVIEWLRTSARGPGPAPGAG
ncbi:MAG TPA: peroxiredoxin [Chloroflexota bacterium]|nr:peroxiredoxin [Chloroflexota bacterium]